MFGRIRSSSSFDSLDRPPSKILKDDSLSIYEATLMKLKLGSQHHVDPPIKENLEGPETDSDSSLSCAEAMNIEARYDLASFSRRSCELANSPKEDPMTVHSDFSISSTCASEASGESTENSRQCSIKNYSILYLFSKFKSSPGSQTISEAMTTEDICYVGGMSPSSSTSQSTNNIELHSEQAFVDSLTALSENVL